MRVLYNTPLTEKFLNDLEAKVTKAVKEKQTNSAFGGKLTNGIEKVCERQKPQFDEFPVSPPNKSFSYKRRCCCQVYLLIPLYVHLAPRHKQAILMQLKSESTEEKQGFKEIFVVLRDGSGKNRVFNHKRAVVKVPTGWPDL